MARQWRFCFLCVVVVFLISHANAQQPQEDRFITSLRTQSDFATWPGKRGPLKRGLIFLVADYRDLAGFSIIRDDLDDGMKNLGMVRKISLSRSSEILDITIGVAHSSTDNAHELLLLGELALSQMRFVDRLQRGDGNGVDVGDFNFILKRARLTDLQGYIAFVRNNVICIIRDGRPDNPSTVNVQQLAADIDARITALPDLTPEEFNTLSPGITAFRPVDDTLVAEEGSFTALNIAVSAPSGEVVKLKFSSEGKLEIDTSIDPVRISATHVFGVIPIELIAINDSLQFGQGETSVTVIPPPSRDPNLPPFRR